MKKYNYEYINTHYALMEAFLFKADKNVWDISYHISKNHITIQVVLAEGFTLSNETIANVKKCLIGLDIVISELYLTEAMFNESKGNWQPQYYQWLDYLLFSKAEIL